MRVKMKLNRSKSSLVACVCFASLCALPGCWWKKAPTPPAKSPTLMPSEVWHKMVVAYQSATSYHDVGTVSLSYKQAGHAVEDKADVQVTFVRPNKLRVNDSLFVDGR